MRTLLLGLCLLLSACSTTKVVLYARYLDDDARRVVTESLENKGFEVQTNEYAFPENINHNALIYAPVTSKQAHVDSIVSGVAESGWEIFTLQPLKSNNHWYTRNTYGLFLVPEDVNLQAGVTTRDLVGNYDSTQCDGQLTLSLGKDYTARVVAGSSPEPLWEGRWRVKAMPVLELFVDSEFEWPMYFEVGQSREVDKISAIDILRLTPVDDYRLLQFCHFASGERV